jgi:phosphoglycolate phosphatase
METSMRYNTLLFDLDGTLTDPGLGITNSVMYALGKFGITVPERKELYRFIGGPLRESFALYYGLSAEDAETAVAFYREYYAPRGIFENEAYPGIEELLRALKSDGAALLVATLKPTVFAVQVLEHFGLDRYFDFISGSELDGSRSDKLAVIERGFTCCPTADRTSAVMVGDRLHDIRAARQAGIASVGVLYGYGGRDEVAEAGPDHIAETVADLSGLLLL